MEIPIGRFRLNITLARAADRRKGWEELVAVGMDDLELARLNLTNVAPPDHVVQEWLRLGFGFHRRP